MHPELIVIDGNSLAYRAFFALPASISTQDGRPTNALLGFSAMLIKILEGRRCPTVVCWDAGSSGRKELYPDYKATRGPRPELLQEQWPYLAPLVEACGWRNVTVDGYEADDVIATLAQGARTADPRPSLTIVTGDRDALQLVDDDGPIRVVAPARGLTETTTYDRAAVIEKWGVGPELIPDLYGLKGDSSDNIPGVPGIGDKTASALVAQFGDLESVLASTDQISGPKRKQNLIDHADNARLSKVLATMQRDLPVDLSVFDDACQDVDVDDLRTTFHTFELREPLMRLEAALGLTPQTPEEIAGLQASAADDQMTLGF